MKFVWIIGPQAAGKMTVGQELEKITGLKLFHNHMTIDLVGHFFDYDSSSGKRLVNLFRREIFKEAAASDLEGMIFTYVWAFNMREDWNFVKQVTDIFESMGNTVCFVELEAELDERLLRNKSSNRLEHKPSKRNIEWSEKDLLDSMEEHRLNSFEGEIKHENYFKINNTNVHAEEAAELIKKRFCL